MSCPEFEELIVEYAQPRNTLSPAETARIETHLALCEDCRAVLEFQAALDARLDRTIARPRLSSAFEHRLRLRIGAESARPARFPLLLDWAGYATLAVAGGWLLQQYPATAIYLTWTAVAASFAFSLWVAVKTLIPLHWR